LTEGKTLKAKQVLYSMKKKKYTVS
jgi:hypothetical protein